MCLQKRGVDLISAVQRQTFKAKQPQRLLWTLFWVAAFQAVTIASTTGLAWEKPIGVLAQSVSGPVALGVAIIAIVVIGIGMYARPDIFEFGSKATMIPLISAVVLGVVNIISTLFPGLVGALV